MMRRRQVLALNGVGLAALTSGCAELSDDAGDDVDTTDDRGSTTDGNVSGDENDDTDTDVSDATITRQFGECHGDHGLELTVFEPTFERVVSTSEDVLELPDETGVAFVPVAFYNRTDERQGLFAPTFTLVGEDLSVEERIDVPLGEEDRTDVQKHDLLRVERDGRWNSHGTGIEPEGSFTTTLVFVVPTDVDTDGVHVLFEPILGMENVFDGDVIAWGDP